MPFLQKWPCTIDNIFTLLFYLTTYPGNHSILIHKDEFMLLLFYSYSTSLGHPLFTHTVYTHWSHFQYFAVISNVVIKNSCVYVFSQCYGYIFRIG